MQLAADAHRLLGRDAEGVDEPRDLAARVADRLARPRRRGRRPARRSAPRSGATQ